MRTNIKTIPHKQQRYPTVGDWWWDDKNILQIRVSEMSNSLYEQLVAMHEYVEATLCEEDGVGQADVDAFDIAFERNRHGDDKREPGDDRRAPYYKQHQTATAIERLMAVSLGVDWQAYEKEVNEL